MEGGREGWMDVDRWRDGGRDGCGCRWREGGVDVDGGREGGREGVDGGWMDVDR